MENLEKKLKIKKIQNSQSWKIGENRIIYKIKNKENHWEKKSQSSQKWNKIAKLEENRKIGGKS